MPIDPSKFSSALSADTTKSPRELYDLLTNKDPRYKYPRDVQTEVFDKWSELRESADAILKMNTGSGKTLVGLLILKVCLNEGVTPAVYVAPSKHLAARVIQEAKDLTLETTDDPDSPRVISGKAILVISVDRLINGRSVFGVDRVKIRIGTLLIDDAHACVAAAEEKFTLTAGGAVFTELLALFKPDLEKQSPRGYLDVEAADPRQLLLVPFWAWIDKQKDVLSILRTHATEKDVEWSLPLLQDHLQLCRCVFGGGKVEISPRCLPISVIPSFGAAKRRIYMSATFRDDSVLVTHFDAKPGPLKEAITPKTGGDIGDRMILVPQEANPDLTDEDLRGLFTEVAKTRNVVVLVPSRFRAQFWSSVAKKTLDVTNLIEGIESLKAGHVGLVVLINKYDGIDLPGDACQVLVVDGLPDVRRMVEKIDQGALIESEMLLSQSIQRIEQGMGRGIRSKEDYCAVFLMGRTLISHLYAQDALRFFTSATRAQLQFSREASSQLEKGTIKDFSDAIDLFLGRNTIWVQKGRAAVVGAEYNNALALTPTALSERAAFNAASVGNFLLAATEMQNAINGEKDPRVRAWLKVELAEYQHRVNASDAQLTLKAAVAANNQLTRPLDGIQYIKMGSLTADQASRTITYLRETYPDPNKLIIDVNGLIDTLVFAPETAIEFQRAMARVPFLMGLKGQQPEAETGRGPDDLWNLGDTRFAVIECKNGATSDRPINKHDCNQLTGSMEWFREMYGDLCSATPILVHPQRSFEHAATPHEGARIMNAEKLADLRAALRGFAVGVAALPSYGTAEQVGQLLQTHGLVSGSLVQRFTTTVQA